MEKEKLCRIFFALYSFENLEFGFDGAMDVISVSDQRKAMLAWLKGIGSNLANSLVMMPQKTIWKIRYSLLNE